MKFVEFLRDNWSILLSVAISFASLIAYIIKARREGNTKKQLKLFEQIPDLVREAELMFVGEKQGLSRLNYVLTKLRVYALENNIKVDTISLEDQVNNEVKTLNLNKTDNTPKQVSTDTSVVVDTSPNVSQDNLNI